MKNNLVKILIQNYVSNLRVTFVVPRKSEDTPMTKAQTNVINIKFL